MKYAILILGIIGVLANTVQLHDRENVCKGLNIAGVCLGLFAAVSGFLMILGV